MTLDKVNIEVPLASIANEIDHLTNILATDFVSDERRAFVLGALNALSWIRDGMDRPSQWLSSTQTS